MNVHSLRFRLTAISVVLVAVGLIGALYVGGTASAGLLGGRPAGQMPGAFAHSVVPVALGYVVAHYYSFLVFEGQRAFVKLSDLVGRLRFTLMMPVASRMLRDIQSSDTRLWPDRIA